MSTQTNDSKDDPDDDSKDDPDDPTLLIFAAIVVAYLGFRTKSSTMRSCDTSLVAIPVAIAVYIYLLNDRDIFLKKLQTSLLTPLVMLVSWTASLFKEDVKEAVKETAKKTAERAANVAAERAVATDQVKGANAFAFLTKPFGEDRVGDWDKIVPSLSTKEFEQVAAIRASQGIAQGPQAYLRRITSDLDGPYWRRDLPSDLSADLVGKYQLGRLFDGFGKTISWAVAIQPFYQTYKGIDTSKLAAFWSTYAIAKSAHENRETCRRSFKCSDDQTWSDCTARVDRNNENFERCQKFFEDDFNRTAIQDRARMSAEINKGFEQVLEVWSPVIVAGVVTLANWALPTTVASALGPVGWVLSFVAQLVINFVLGYALKEGLSKIPYLTKIVGSLSKMFYDASSWLSSSSSSSCKDFSRECEQMSESEPSDWEDKFHKDCSWFYGERMDALNVCKEEKFNTQCYRKLSLTYHPDKKQGDKEKMVASKNFNALSDCKEKTELKRSKKPPPLEQTVAPAVAGIATAASLIIVGAAPIALPAAGMTAALMYFAVDRDEE